MTEQFEGFKKGSGCIRDEAREKTAGYILGALGLVAGLAWNDAVHAFIDAIFPAEQGNGILAKFIYAIFITIFVVIASLSVTKFIIGKKEEEGK